MAASSTYRLPLTGCTIAIASTFFAPPPTYLSSTRILHLQGGVTLKTLPVLNYSVPLSFSLSSSFTSSSTFYSPCFFSLRQTSSPPSQSSLLISGFLSRYPRSSPPPLCFPSFRLFCSRVRRSCQDVPFSRLKPIGQVTDTRLNSFGASINSSGFPRASGCPAALSKMRKN